MDITLEDNYIAVLCETGKLKELQNMYNEKSLTRETIAKNNFYIFWMSCAYGQLEIVQWLHKNFQFTKKEVILVNNNYGFRMACAYGYLNVCEWLYKTFELTKAEVTLGYNEAFERACYNNHYNIIYFLVQNFNITFEENKKFINEFPKDEKEKILECFVPFGSFTKPVNK